MPLRTAKDFADQLAAHVNHLNKVLKDDTGRTTDLIGGRLAQEAKALLRQTDWSLWEIADCLGFVSKWRTSPTSSAATPPRARRFPHVERGVGLISTNS